MNTPSPEDRVRVLESYFVGRTDAYALQQNDGNYRVYQRTLDRSILSRHTSGELTVATVMLSHEGTPVGVFDIDTKGEDTQKLIRAIVDKSQQELDLPCFVEPSGRKGYHLWFIFKNMLDAGLVRHFLIRLLESCHPSGRVPMDIEIFPKQSSAENLGNAIKLPFGIHKRTNKRTLFINVSDFTPMDDWGISALDKSPPIDLEQIKIALGKLGTSAEAEKRASGAPRKVSRHKGMLLCYPKMDAGVPEGQRDEVMFRRAVHFWDQEYDQKIAHEALLQINRRNRPPMEKKEIANKIKQAYTGRYGYGCNNPVIAQFCDSACPVYNRRNEPGIGKDLEDYQDAPTTIETSDIPHNMKIIPTVPPYYEVAVREQWVTVDWEEITTPTSFANSVHRQGKGLLNIPWKKPRWTKHIQGLMKDATREKAPQSTSEWYEVVDLLYQWLQGTPPAENYESIPEGRPMLRDGRWYFRGTDATLQLKNRFRLSAMSTGKLWAEYVWRLGGNSHRVTLEGGERLDLWYVPKDRSPIGPPEEKEEDDKDFWGTDQSDKDFWG